MSAKSNIAAVAAIGALVVANDAGSAQHRANSRNLPHPARASERYGHRSRQVPQYDATSGVYDSDSLGHQSFPNPDRDFSIENLSSHPSN